YTKRINIRLSAQVVAGLSAKFANPPKQIGGREIVQFIQIDGNKYLFADGSWMLFRESGTEPVVRLYAEAKSAAEVNALIDLGRKFIME
ncbi:MAG: phosphoglucomutase/phosphomannomutase family protein, partial [Deltaproteobacteria bacterium]|nr:phosphoglucomutase/phosphomannomutase family protein [Deltaproteobacteria bacterium]